MTYIPDALRKLVSKRAHDLCEYCLLHKDDSPASHQIDHIIPVKHRGKTSEDNLCLACLDCNKNKGSDFNSFDPLTNNVTFLFNPCTDRWDKHFELLKAKIVPKTDVGRVTEYILQLNHPDRLLYRDVLIDTNRYPRPKGEDDS